MPSSAAQPPAKIPTWEDFEKASEAAERWPCTLHTINIFAESNLAQPAAQCLHNLGKQLCDYSGIIIEAHPLLDGLHGIVPGGIKIGSVVAANYHAGVLAFVQQHEFQLFRALLGPVEFNELWGAKTCKVDIASLVEKSWEQAREVLGAWKDIPWQELATVIRQERAHAREKSGWARPKERDQCRHSEDFTQVEWYGTPYRFTLRQAACVRVLWKEWEGTRFGLHEKTIGERIDTSNFDYRLRDTFRVKGKSPHPAWGEMIVGRGGGVYGLEPSRGTGDADRAAGPKKRKSLTSRK
jgi:hypothetical protein